MRTEQGEEWKEQEDYWGKNVRDRPDTSFLSPLPLFSFPSHLFLALNPSKKRFATHQEMTDLVQTALL